MKRETWRLLIIVATILGALYYLFPTYQFYYAPPDNPDELERVKKQAINLGLDLQGGIHLVLEVDHASLSESDWNMEATSLPRKPGCQVLGAHAVDAPS